MHILLLFVLLCSSLVFSADYLAPMEMSVSLGWGHFVEFIAAVHFDASFENIAKMQPLLAQRILRLDDSLTSMSGLNTKQMAAAAVFVLLYELGTCKHDCYSNIMDAWKSAMTTEAGRDHGRHIMMETFDDPSTFPGNLAVIVKDIIVANSAADLAKLVASCGLCGPEVVSLFVSHL